MKDATNNAFKINKKIFIGFLATQKLNPFGFRLSRKCQQKMDPQGAYKVTIIPHTLNR